MEFTLKKKKELSAMKLNSDKQKYAYVFPMFWNTIRKTEKSLPIC